MKVEVVVLKYSHPRYPWRVAFPTADGRRYKPCKNKTQAEDFKIEKEAELAKGGTLVSLTPAEHRTAIYAREILGPHGKKLEDAVKHYAKFLKNEKKDISKG